MCRRSGRCSSAAASTAPRRSSGASAGRRPTATSSTSTGRARTLDCAAARALPRPRGLVVEPLRAGLRRRGDAARLALRGAALSRLLGRDQPRAARLPLGRPRGGRLDAGALSCAPRRADRRRRRLARRQCAAALRRGSGRRARADRVRAVAAVSAPLDLAAGGRAIGRGFSRQVYTRMFLRTMKTKGARQARPASRACSTREAMRAARDLRDFDEVFTGPLHGFTGADDYYARSSAKAAPGPHPHSGPGAERAQRSVPAGLGAARGLARSARA